MNTSLISLRGAPRFLVRAGLAGLVLLGATAARATPSFPGVIRAELGLSSAPNCSVCHQGPTMVGTVTTPFGAALRNKGLVFYDEASLRKSLSALDSGKVDSDGDGTPDTDELKAGRDPNKSDVPGTTPITEGPPDPFYGCTAAPGAPWALVLGVWGLGRRRRR